MNPELKTVKDRYVALFLLAVVARVAAGLATDFEPGAPRSPVSIAVNLLAFALALAFLWHTYRLARGLGYGFVGTFLALAGSLLPLINLTVIVVLLRKYKEVQNVRLNFLLQDVPA